MNSAWDEGLTVGGQIAFPCYDKEVFMRLVENAKPSDDPDHHQFAFFTFQPPFSLIEKSTRFSGLDHFIGCMHGTTSSNSYFDILHFLFSKVITLNSL